MEKIIKKIGWVLFIILIILIAISQWAELIIKLLKLNSGG